MAVFAQSDLQPVAIVRLTKSEPITVKQLKSELEKAVWPTMIQRLARLPTAAELDREIRNLSIEERRFALDAMINERLAMQAAERDRITVAESEINQQITQLKTQMTQILGRQPTDEEFATAVKNETGRDLPELRDYIKRQALVQKYMVSKKQSHFTNIKEPTEAEIINHFNLTRTQYVRPEMVRFSMIAVPFGTDTASKTKAKEVIDRLNREIGMNSSRFDEAVIKSQSPNSGYRAGDGGYLPRNQAAQQRAGTEFVNTAFTLKQGEVSRVIEGNQAYHIIKVTENLPQKSLELDEILEPGTSVTVRQFIAVGLLQQAQQEAVNRATQELVTELRTGNPFDVMANNLAW